MRHHQSSDPEVTKLSADMCRDRRDTCLTRVTKDGRTLTYFIKVIQQPSRARACGSGAKSSADRRPVDPPPVVEMRIFEGDGPLEERNDVTFTYDANFFLFTTLEIARPIAHGRMQAPAPQVPVLTGMPVSGMAYLDRPGLAGYFIFPDLSVRHEGQYRLSFSLYEETKNPGDADAEPANGEKKPPIPGAASPNASFDWRLDIKSQEFTVYSAKKFPGLTESTLLSKTVAEQGCRVRIRRDIRMRRRGEGESGNDYDAAAEEQYARAGRTPSIQDYRERSRSLSNESVNRHAYPDMERRVSGEYPRAYPYPGSRPQSYLTFGGAAGNQYQAPPPRFAQPAPPPAAYQTAPPTAPPHPAQYRQPAPPHEDAFNRPPQPLASSTSSQNTPTRDRYESHPEHPAPTPKQGRSWSSGSETTNPHDLPKIGTLLPPIRNITRRAAAREARTLAPIVHITHLKALEPGETESTERAQTSDRVLPQPAPAAAAAAPSPAANNPKRTHQAAFDPKAKAQMHRLYNGKRPEEVQVNGESSSDDADDDEPMLERMVYKRANGTLHAVLREHEPV